MKNLAICFFLTSVCVLPFCLQSQTAMFTMLQKFNKDASPSFKLQNHTVLNYTKALDDNFDKVVNYNNVEYQMNLFVKDSVVYHNNRYTTYSTVYNKEVGSSTTSEKIIFLDAQNKATKMVQKFGDDLHMLNEETTYTYDAKNRIVKVTLFKPNMNLDGPPKEQEVFKCYYSSDKMFPDSIVANIMVTLKMIPTMVKDTIVYTIASEVPKDLIEMAKKELGPKASHEEIMEALGPFGKPSKQISKIYKVGPDLYREDAYTVDKDNVLVEKMEVVFNANWIPVSMSNGSEKTTYRPDGKIDSVTSDDNTLTYEYDADGQLLKEMAAFSTTYYEYHKGNKIKSFTIFSSGDLSDYAEYKY